MYARPKHGFKFSSDGFRAALSKRENVDTERSFRGEKRLEARAKVFAGGCGVDDTRFNVAL